MSCLCRLLSYVIINFRFITSLFLLILLTIIYFSTQRTILYAFTSKISALFFPSRKILILSVSLFVNIKQKDFSTSVRNIEPKSKSLVIFICFGYKSNPSFPCPLKQEPRKNDKLFDQLLPFPHLCIRSVYCFWPPFPLTLDLGF